MSSGTLVALEAITKYYGEEVRQRALSDIEFELERGEFVALIGPSGSGKSTLLNLLGLLDRPSSGRVLLDGVDTTALSEHELTAQRGKMLGFIFQFHHLLPAFTALENVLLPAWGQSGFPSRTARARATELLGRVGLAERLNRRTNQLSGGEQQRVAVARALVHSPPLVLADEPTGNLDTESSNQVFELMRRFNVERGTTFLVVTHDPRIAGRCDRVLEIVDGRLQSDRRSSSQNASPSRT